MICTERDRIVLAFALAANERNIAAEDLERAASDGARQEARRSAETLERLLEALGPTAAPRVETREELYLGGQRTLLDAVRELPKDTSRVLLIAHNPDLHELAVSLSGSGEPGPLAALKERFPTGALAVLGLSDWAEANAGVGRLKEFVRPRDLS